MGFISTRMRQVGSNSYKKNATIVKHTQESGIPDAYIKTRTLGNEIGTIVSNEYVKEVIIGSCVQSIGNYAFYGFGKLTSVTIPDSVVSIGNSAFANCRGLTSITIGNGVTSIGDSAFKDCSGLTSVTIPDSVTSIGGHAFSGCSRLVAISVDSNNPAYKSVDGLLLSKDGTTLVHGVNGDVTIPDGVTSIGSCAFYGCSRLTSVTIPNSVTNIAGSAFAWCSCLTNVTIPNSVTSIGELAFFGCRGLTSVTIPNSVTNIGPNAFSGCSNVREATVPGWKCTIPFGNVTNLVISTGTTSIGYQAFINCSGLTSVTIPNSVTSIAGSAFQRCSALTNVTIGDNVTVIGESAFSECGRLTGVTIPDSVTSIGSQAFSSCSGLTSVTIGNSVTSIGSSAFLSCTQLSSMTFQGKTISRVQSMSNYDFGIGKCYDYDSPQPNTSIPVTVTCSDGSFTIPWTIQASCFLKGTDILLADGTTKKVENLTYDDVLKVWDFDEGQLGSAKVCWLTRPGLKNDHYYQLTFDDGTVLKTTGVNSNHRIFSVDQSKFTNVCDAKVGDKVYSINGVLTITDVQYIEEECEYWNVITSQKYNCFANGILTSDRYGNIYPISDMKYVKDGRTIRPYSDYEAVGISRYWYDNFRLGEVNETINKTREYVMKCEAQMLPVGEQQF